MNKLYVGIDLHSNNSYFAAKDAEGNELFHKRIKNSHLSVEAVLSQIRQKGEIESLAVESTYNWYWIVDYLQDLGYNIQLTNPGQIKQYNGIKKTDDKSDAFFLAELQRLKILPSCWICPKEDRPIRDLLRTRMNFVQKRTSFKNSLTSIISRQTGLRLSSDQILKLTHTELEQLVEDELIYFRLLQLHSQIRLLSSSIADIEKECLKRLKNTPEFIRLMTVPGIGKLLAMVITTETGDIKRFTKSGKFTSYCRAVNSQRTSNGKNKGKNNSKNGNRYLSWAFSEAAVNSKRYCESANKYWQRKNSKTSKVVAYKSLAAKLSKACYYIMRDGTEYCPKKLFGYESETLSSL